MLDLDVGTKAKVGQILILISVILKVLGLLGIIASATVLGSALPILSVIPFGVGAMLAGIAIVILIGITLGFLSLKSASEGDFHKAGVIGIIASLLPPLDIIMILGGILCLVSEEAS